VTAKTKPKPKAKAKRKTTKKAPPKPIDSLDAAKQTHKLDPEAIDLLLTALATNPTVRHAVRDFKNLSGVEISEQTAYNVRNAHTELYELKVQQAARSVLRIPIAFAAVRLAEYSRMYDEAKSNTERRAILEDVRKDATLLGVEGMGFGTVKEVEEFLSSIGFGSKDTPGVCGTTRPTDTD
jgi:hypothetical protein